MRKHTTLLVAAIIVLLALNLGASLTSKPRATTVTTTVSTTKVIPQTTSVTVTSYGTVTTYSTKTREVTLTKTLTKTTTAHETETETITTPGPTTTYTRTVTHTATAVRTRTSTVTETVTHTVTVTPPPTTTKRAPSNYEILKYFPIKAGHYVTYRFTDTANNMSDTYQVTIQQEASTNAGLIFLMTFAKINGTWKPLNSALYGRADPGEGMLLFFAGCPVKEEIQLWFKVLKLPLDVTNGTTFNYGTTHYKLLKLSKVSVNGKTFNDVIKVVVNNEYDPTKIVRGSGTFYLAKGVGIVKIAFRRTDGTNLTVTILDWGEEKPHVINGTLTIDGLNPATPQKGDFAVGLTTCDMFYGKRNPAFTEVGNEGRFSLQVYGKTFSLYYGPYAPMGSNKALITSNLKESVINTDSLPSKSEIYLSMGLPPPKNAMNEFRNNTELVALAKNLHKQAWFYVVTRAFSKPEYKYAIYESRTLAVKHPEIYLRADALFNKLLTTAPGMWSYYMVRTQNLLEQKKLYDEIRSNGGEKFDWGRFNISMHKPIWYKEIYDNTPAFYPFIDIRLYFMGTALKGTDWHAPPLSMAEFLYFKYEDEGFKPYLIVTSNGTAFVAFKQGSNYTVINYRGKKTDDVPKNVILIFNEDYVWYPLMGRNDTGKDPDLKYLVSRYGKGNPIPNLTKDEEKLVAMLRNCTELSGKLDYAWATYFAGKLHIRSWQYFPNIFEELYPEDAAMINYQLSRWSHGPNTVTARNTYVTRISNLLSPETATLAALAKYVGSRGGTLDTIMYTWLGFFLNYVATLDNPRQGGLSLWFHSELFFVGMDDAMLSKAGNCVMMQTIMASVLDLANFTGMEVYVAGFTHTIGSGRLGGHATLAIYWGKQYGLAENYLWEPCVNAFDLQGPLGFNFIVTTYGWVVLSEHPPYDNGKIRASLNYSAVYALIHHVKELAPHMHVVKFTEPFTGVWEPIDVFIQTKLKPGNVETYPF